MSREDIFKVIIVGNMQVGKTALMRRFTEDTFEDDYKITIGVQPFVKFLQIDDETIKLSIFDTGGQERFAKIRPLYFSGAVGAVIVYSITDRGSFLNLNYWFDEVKKHTGGIPLILVGNKADLEDDRTVVEQEVFEVSEKFNTSFFETSAKTGKNVEAVFEALAKEMIEYRAELR